MEGVPLRKKGATSFVSVVVPVYNDAERLARCLEALEHQTYPSQKYEVLVVDNGSDEPVAPAAVPFEHARVLTEPRRGSYAARNKGVTEARGEMIAFTDADCVPAPTWIEEGAKCLGQGARRGLVGGRVEFTFQNAARPNAAELYDSSRFLKQKRNIERDRFALTANAFTLQSVFDDVGLFDATLKSGGDAEWGQRVAAAGYALAYAEEARVTHPARHTHRAVRNKVLRVLEGHYRLKHEENYPLRDFLMDVVRDIGHPIKFMLRAIQNNGLRGFSGKGEMLVAFPLQGLAVALKRIQLRMGHARSQQNT